jgi:hypothetical protein
MEEIEANGVKHGVWVCGSCTDTILEDRAIEESWQRSIQQAEDAWLKKAEEGNPFDDPRGD